MLLRCDAPSSLYAAGMKPPAFPLMPVAPMALMVSVVITNVLLIRRLRAVERRLSLLGS